MKKGKALDFESRSFKKRFGVCLCLFRRLDEKLSMFFKNVRVFGHSG